MWVFLIAMNSVFKFNFFFFKLKICRFRPFKFCWIQIQSENHSHNGPLLEVKRNMLNYFTANKPDIIIHYSLQHTILMNNLVLTWALEWRAAFLSSIDNASAEFSRRTHTGSKSIVKFQILLTELRFTQFGSRFSRFLKTVNLGYNTDNFDSQ